MMVPTHLAAGLFSGAGAVAWLQVPPVPTVWLLLGALIGALLPDIDHPKSWLGRRLPLLSLPLSAIFGHRGITHSLLAVVGVVWALHQALTQWAAIHHGHWRWIGMGVAVGYLSHLLGDFATHGGVPSGRRSRVLPATQAAAPLLSIAQPSGIRQAIRNTVFQLIAA